MPVGETTTISKQNKKCPKCGAPMGWTEGLLRDGGRDVTKGRYSCMPCQLICKQADSRAVRRGKNLAKKYKGIPAMDERITRLSTAEQIGLLRARQHHR